MKDFWESVYKTSKEIRETWPEWKRKGAAIMENRQPFYQKLAPPDRHPCNSNCCDNPDIVTPECDHDHFDPDWERCDTQWCLECINCGSFCSCEV